MKHLKAQRRSRAYTAIIAFIICTAPTLAVASTGRVATERFTEYAKVTKVEPIFREIRLREPQQRCRTEQERYIVGYEQTRPRVQRHSNHNTAGNALVGGIIGGVIGNQLGRSHSNRSRTGATVAGAIIGSAIGGEASHQRRGNKRYRHTEQVQSTPIYETREVQRCNRTVESRTEHKLQHYNVTYLYKGRSFVTQLPRDPGKRLELQVSVSPARR